MRIFPVWWAEHGSCTCPQGVECVSPAKHPLTRNGVKDATDDPDQLSDWRLQWPKANWAVATGNGLLVVDLDVKPGKDGRVTLSKLGTVPRTYAVRTGSGGIHLYFRVSKRLPNTTGKLGLGVDTRCDGGYVLAPGSNHISGGSYSVAIDESIADAPEWLIERLVPRTAPAAEQTFPPASAEVLRAARNALAEHGPAIQGDGGDAHTWQAMAVLSHDYALTESEAFPLAKEWNTTCQPPWSDSALLSKLRGGRKYGKAEFGCKRKVPPLPAARKIIADWHAAGGTQDGIPGMIEQVRLLASKGVLPSEAYLMEAELKSATSLPAKAFALPKGRPLPLPGQGGEDLYGFDCSASGVPLTNLNNVVILLEHESAKSKDRPLSFDTFLQKVVKQDGSEWTDADTLAFTLYLQRQIGLQKVTTATTLEGVVAFARRNECNAVVDYFSSLKHDGTKRIARFLSTALGAEDNDYTRSASQNFWRSMAARALIPGCKVDNMIVLEGAQGILKSTALQVIAGPAWFAEASESPHSKDFFQGLQGKLLIEIAELDSFNRADVTAVKRVLSCCTDRYRVSYGKITQDFPRQGIFAGTTNRSDWSKDDTGARRFWPIQCTRVDVELIKKHRDQLFAEAVADVQAGAKWWEMPREATAAVQEARRQVDPWEELLERHFATDINTEFDPVDLLANPLGLESSRMGKAEQARLGSILKHQGFVKAGKVWRRT